jgi:hypothetical protein
MRTSGDSMSDTNSTDEKQAPLGIGAQIACVRREIAMRERVYPSFVARGKMKSSAAEYELRAMRDVLATLERIQ